MAFKVEIDEKLELEHYEAIAHLAPAVEQLEAEVAGVAGALKGRTVWMVNSTAQGGGVAEMLPTFISLMRQLGIAAEWAVIESEQAAFFDLTKRLHNMIHGAGAPGLGAADREVYEAANEQNAEFLLDQMKDGDVLVVHDPQPMALANIVKQQRKVHTIWRCHIGLDEDNASTRDAWEFLAPYAGAYDHAVFSADEYVPEYFADRSTLIYPAIDPLTPKNQDLRLHKTVGVLANSALAANPGPIVRSPFAELALRLQPHGDWRPASVAEDIGLLTRPIVTQVSRWDRLKGFVPLMHAFAALKQRLRKDGESDRRHLRRLKLARLVLAGPDPSSIADDPEGLEVIEELRAAYLALPSTLQDDIALVTLPMHDNRENSLIVNALQRASSIVVQNSLREGFGLTVTEAMWKRIPVLSNTRACGPRQQIRDGIDGRMVSDPEDAEELAAALDDMLRSPEDRESFGRSAQRRVHEKFLITSQLSAWVQLLASAVAR